jgi:uncharacterized glyoxalase superfamily protein PhnB
MTTQAVYPALRYIDAPGAIAWLERAFGFRAEDVYAGEAGTIAHAQLRAGSDLLMLGSSQTGPPLGARSSPKALGGRGTMGMYLCTSDTEAIYALAQAAGATIVRPLATVDYDDYTSFTARDCEGYVWSFGGYAPVPNAGLAPCMRYDDPVRTIAWLRDTCGFTEKLVVPHDDGRIAHSELLLGSSVVMCSSSNDDDLAIVPPAAAGGTTGSVYVFVANPDALYARMLASDTRVTRPIEDTDYGSREFSVLDPEGNGFGFGTYHP